MYSTRSVPEAELRQRFNEGDFEARARSGEFRVTVFYDEKASKMARQPKGTRSQMLEYSEWETGEVIAVVHQYRRPDGALGGSGHPDPKRLREGDIIYIPL